MTKININNLSKEQLEELEKQIAEAKKVLTTSYGRKRVEKWEEYYLINTYWAVDNYIEESDNTDNWAFNIWNYYLTQEEAEQVRDRQLAIVRVNDAIDKLNGGIVDIKWKNYIIICKSRIFYMDWTIDYSVGSVINLCKSEEIAEKIISEYEDDLKIIFNIK